jgi:tellurite resistance protein TehA-like permease
MLLSFWLNVILVAAMFVVILVATLATLGDTDAPTLGVLVAMISSLCGVAGVIINARRDEKG